MTAAVRVISISCSQRPFDLCNLFVSESGASGIEYGIIAATIALMIVAGAQLTGDSIDNVFQVVGITMQEAENAAHFSTAN